MNSVSLWLVQCTKLSVAMVFCFSGMNWLKNQDYKKAPKPTSIKDIQSWESWESGVTAQSAHLLWKAASSGYADVGSSAWIKLLYLKEQFYLTLDSAAGTAFFVTLQIPCNTSIFFRCKYSCPFWSEMSSLQTRTIQCILLWYFHVVKPKGILLQCYKHFFTLAYFKFDNFSEKLKKQNYSFLIYCGEF